MLSSDGCRKETSQKFFGRWKDRESKAFQHKRNRIDWWWTDRYIPSRDSPVRIRSHTNLSSSERRAEALLWEVRIHQSKAVCRRIGTTAGNAGEQQSAESSSADLGTFVNPMASCVTSSGWRGRDLVTREFNTNSRTPRQWRN